MGRPTPSHLHAFAHALLLVDVGINTNVIFSAKPPACFSLLSSLLLTFPLAYNVLGVEVLSFFSASPVPDMVPESQERESAFSCAPWDLLH